MTTSQVYTRVFENGERKNTAKMVHSQIKGKLSVKINRYICEIKKKGTVYGMVCLLCYSQQIRESW